MDKCMSVCSYFGAMNNTTTTKCACPDCKCEVTEGHRVLRDGKEYCGENCASGHANGDGCCENTCKCHG